MATETIVTEGERSMPELLKELASGMGELARKESELARAEMMRGVREAQRASLWLMAALVPLAVGLVLFALAIAYALDAFLPMWLAALIPGVVLLGVAGAMALAAKRSATRAAGDLKPDESARSLRETKEFLGDQIGHLKQSVTGRA